MCGLLEVFSQYSYSVSETETQLSRIRTVGQLFLPALPSKTPSKSHSLAANLGRIQEIGPGDFLEIIQGSENPRCYANICTSNALGVRNCLKQSF
jgi:hypothetical protein